MGDKLNIDRLTADAVELLREMIAIPSPSFEETAVCSHISDWLNARDIEHKRIGNNIVAEHITDPTRPALMLCAHIDTVSPSPEYSFDPYQPENCPEDMVQGLGSNDDGASVVAMTAAYRYFHNHHSREHNNIGNAAQPNLILVLSCEEERSGKDGMTGLWPELADKVDFAIVGEPTGMRAATSERGLLVIDATAHGVSGHAARNEGCNAMYKALEDIDRLRRHSFDRISPRMGKVNLNVTQINAGTAHNVIPDRCSFVIDIRPTEQYTNEEILSELQEICTSELRARNLSNRSSATFEDSPLQKTAEALGIETFSSPTTSDWMRISCDAVKMGPGDSSRSHKKDEFVFIDEIRKGIEQYITFINKLMV